jgi:hypothetical protein
MTTHCVLLRLMCLTADAPTAAGILCRPSSVEPTTMHILYSSSVPCTFAIAKKGAQACACAKVCTGLKNQLMKKISFSL